MSIGILRRDGEIVLHQKRHASLDAFLKAIAPSRDKIIIAIECLLRSPGSPTSVPRKGCLVS